MVAKRIFWDRNKLYDEIWEKPATQDCGNPKGRIAIKRLHEEVHRWVQVNNSGVRRGAHQIGPNSLNSQWIKVVDWALAQADRLDRLRPSPASVLDEKVRLW